MRISANSCYRVYINNTFYSILLLIMLLYFILYTLYYMFHDSNYYLITTEDCTSYSVRRTVYVCIYIPLLYRLYILKD